MKTPEHIAVLSPDLSARRSRAPRVSMTGSASVAWLALLVAGCTLVLLFWRPANLPFLGQIIAPRAAVDDSVATAPAAKAEQAGSPQTPAVESATGLSGAEAAELSTRVALLEDVLPDVKSVLEQEKARAEQANAEREQLRLLYQQTIQDSMALALLDIEPLLDQAQRLIAKGSPIQAPLSLLKAAHDRAARAQSDALAPLIRALEQDREQLHVIAQRSVTKAADDLHRLALGVEGLKFQSPAASESASEQGAQDAPKEAESGWLDRLAKSSSELIELPQAARSDDVVRVTEIGASDLGVLPPSARYFLTQNLRSRLLSARLALLMHDRVGFNADRERVLEWMNDHFDLTHEPTRSAHALLNSMAAISEPAVDVSLAKSREMLKEMLPAEPAK
ncbi:MAG: uroporphyrinogen-III C-methyltransferase [Burkholderiaceae bacterium]